MVLWPDVPALSVFKDGVARCALRAKRQRWGCREVKLVELKLLGERGLDLYATGLGVQGEA